jgi:hypothetical protein
MESELNEIKAKLEKAEKIIAQFNSERASIRRYKDELTYREANLRRKYEEVGLSYD